jgi:hypothetical protein
MFPLFHERTRRLICRTMFLLLGVLPTAAVVAWAASFNRDANVIEVRERLETATGLKVSFDACRFTRPGCLLLENLAIVDPHTEQAIFQTRLLDVSVIDNQRILRASQPTVEAVGLQKLWPALENAMRRRDSESFTTRLEAAELTLRWPEGAQTLVGCRVTIETNEKGVSAVGDCQLAHGAEPQTCRFEIDRQIVAGQPSTSFQFETGEGKLPCGLLIAALARENQMGAASTFAGSINGDETPNGWRVGCNGAIGQIELQSVINDQFPQELRGVAEVSALKAEFQDGRLESASGNLNAGPGYVGGSLLAAAHNCLAMQTTITSSQLGTSLTYEKLGLSFAIDSKGLTIKGRCGDRPSGDVICDAKSISLLRESSGGPIPVVALVQMLVPDSRVLVPATRQTDWLLRMLPLPDVLPHDSQTAPRASLGKSHPL